MKQPFHRVRAVGLLCGLVLLVAAGACGTEPENENTTPVGLQPPNDTPRNTILRFIAAYEQKKTAEYRALFTGDFEFEFSYSADPSLANKWAAGWYAADESASARHLFEGGTNLDDVYLEAATSIDLTFSKSEPVDDTEGRDPAKYKVLSTPVDGVVEVPPIPPATEPTTYVVINNSHRFYLVRGDAAVGLTEDQPADSLHWYIWAWKDETVGYAGAREVAQGGREASMPATWGGLKAVYR